MKRQQAAEDAVALGLRTIATGNHLKALPPGPIYGMKVDELEPQSVIKELNTTAAHLTQSSRKTSSAKKENGNQHKGTSGNGSQNQNVDKERIQIQHTSTNHCTVSDSPTPKDILKKLFPSYDDGLLDQVLSQNEQNLVKTIQKLTPHHTHHHHLHSNSDKQHNGNK